VAPRPFWKGYLKLSLVTCPVALTPATSEVEKVRFHTLNRRTGHRVAAQYVDSESRRPVSEEAQARGYARDESHVVLLEEDELEAVRLESVRAIDIENFAPADDVDWIWLENPYYLTPDDPVGVEAFCVIRDAMKSTATVGISRLVLHRRERGVLLKPRGAGIELWTLRYGEEARNPRDIFGRLEDVAPDQALVGLVLQLIEERKRPWSADMVRDPVQKRLLDIIREKKAGRPARPGAPVEPERTPSNVINILDALRRSIAAEAGAKGPPSKGRRSR
jgi:DNA end-binding protein Ku